MRIEHFRYLFNRINGFYLKEHVIMFRKPLEIWNEVTGKGVTFKKLEDALQHTVDGETVQAAHRVNLSSDMHGTTQAAATVQHFFLLMRTHRLKAKPLKAHLQSSEENMLILITNGRMRSILTAMFISTLKAQSPV